jgi:Fe-S-cluster containining protein
MRQRTVKITSADCRSCGACCVGGFDDGAGWADCTAEDVIRMSRHARVWLVTERYGAEFGKVCAFLRGTPGKRCSCSIYATRPSVCAWYQPGGPGCRNARALLELPH